MRMKETSGITQSEPEGASDFEASHIARSLNIEGNVGENGQSAANSAAMPPSIAPTNHLNVARHSVSEASNVSVNSDIPNDSNTLHTDFPNTPSSANAFDIPGNPPASGTPLAANTADIPRTSSDEPAAAATTGEDANPAAMPASYMPASNVKRHKASQTAQTQPLQINPSRQTTQITQHAQPDISDSTSQLDESGQPIEASQSQNINDSDDELTGTPVDFVSVSVSAPPSVSSNEPQPLYLYSTTVSDVGTVRSNNQDSSFAGERLIAICDGMGGHAGGDTASTIAIRSLAHIEQNDPSANVASIASMMETSVMAAHDAIVGKAKRERRLAGMGTTVTAVSLVSGHWVVTHIGDSRAYLLRDGKLRRMTQDHSYVQHLIDTGRITEAEARNHPQRNVVMRVLGDFDIDPHPDIAVIKAEPTDRWLLCSDGLCGVLEDSTIEDMLTTVSDSEECAQRLVAMSLKAGSTDNVTAVVADAILALSATSFDIPHQTPLIGGAASSNLEAIADIVKVPVASAPALRLGRQSPAARAAALSHSRGDSSGNGSNSSVGSANGSATNTASPEAPASDGNATGNNSAGPPASSRSNSKADDDPGSITQVIHVAKPAAARDENDTKASMDTGEIPVIKKKDGRLSADPNDPDVARAIRKERLREKQMSRRRHFHWRLAIIIAVIVAILATLGVGVGAYQWSQTKYYLGKSQGRVAIYQGVNTNFFGAQLSHEIETTNIKVSQLPQSWDEALDQGIAVNSLSDAHSHIAMIRKESKNLKSTKGGSTPLPWADSSKGDSSASKTTSKDSTSSPSDAANPSAPGSSNTSDTPTIGADPKAASK